MDNDLPDDESIDRREFIETSGVAAVAAASWLALTEKTDALAMAKETPTTGIIGGDPSNQDYHYAGG
jgi:phosphodiesterase/alkaline phosphatase D-like protein